jgi:hypothetical protein
MSDDRDRDLAAALDALSRAYGAKALAKAHQKAALAVSRSRKRATRVLGPLAQAWRQALQLAEKMKAEGASASERQQYIANVVREAWPKMREEPWHYLCAACEDSGWIWHTCVNRSCGRPFKLPGQAGDDGTGQGRCQEGHTYVLPCTMCEKGRGYRRQLRKEPRQQEDAVAVAARTSKPTRAGR